MEPVDRDVEVSALVPLLRSFGGAVRMMGWNARRTHNRPGNKPQLQPYQGGNAPPSIGGNGDAPHPTLNIGDGQPASRFDLFQATGLALSSSRARLFFQHSQTGEQAHSHWRSEAIEQSDIRNPRTELGLEGRHQDWVRVARSKLSCWSGRHECCNRIRERVLIRSSKSLLCSSDHGMNKFPEDEWVLWAQTISLSSCARVKKKVVLPRQQERLNLFSPRYWPIHLDGHARQSESVSSHPPVDAGNRTYSWPSPTSTAHEVQA